MPSPPGARPVRFALALATACVGVAAPAAAAPLSAELSVARGAGAEDCPDRDALGRIVERIGGRLRPGGEVRAEVQFARAVTGYQAVLRLEGAKEGERTLTDTGPTCTALGRAVGITLALVLDAGLEAPSEAAPPVVSALPPAASVVVASDLPEPPSTAGFLAITAGPALGLVGAPSLAGGLAFELRAGRRLRVRLDGQYVAPRATAFDSGEVDVTLVAARLRACGVVAGLDAPVQLALCAAGAGGQLRGEGRGYAVRNDAATLGWVAAGGGVELGGGLGRRWTWGVGADALAPLWKSTFSIENRGIAFRSSAAAVVVQASLGVRLW